jgi:hypothetical protein
VVTFAAISLARRAFTRIGVLDNAPRAELLAQFLQTTPASDPRRQRAEQLLQLARDRREAARHG